MARFAVNRTVDLRLRVKYAVDGVQNAGEAINIVKSHDIRELLVNCGPSVLSEAAGKSLIVANIDLGDVGRDENSAREI